MRFLFLILFAGIGVSSLAQSIEPIDSGEVRFLVDVDNGYFEIVIDDSIYLKKYRTALPVGHHTAKVWSPGYVTSLVEFDIEKDQVIDKYVPMAISNDRIDFEREYSDYRMQFHKSFTVPLSITLATAITSGAFMISSYSLKQKIYGDIRLYHAAPDYYEATHYKEQIQLNNTKYNRQRTVFYTTLGLTVAAVGTTIFTYRRFKQNYTEPKLNSPSPFKDKFSWYITPFGGAIKWRFG